MMFLGFVLLKVEDRFVSLVKKTEAVNLKRIFKHDDLTSDIIVLKKLFR